jgi:hypothetical protein
MDLKNIVHFNQTSESKGIGVSLNFAMTQDSVDNLVASIVSRGGTTANGPVDQSWNACEITVLDPDGYRLNPSTSTSQWRKWWTTSSIVRLEALYCAAQQVVPADCLRQRLSSIVKCTAKYVCN